MGAILKWLFRGVVGGLALAGVLAMWLVWSLGQWLGDNNKKDEPVPAVMSLPAPEPAVEAADSALVCACGNGVWCEGPRGGKFCMTEAGAKRYKGGS